jgi:autophagy-related protein 2
MNFLILDGSDITLRHAIVYGITSFDKLHKTLNDVWSPDVKRNQLPGVLSGLSAVRPLVNVGSGVRDLVVVPMREYKKDGRIVRSLQKGVYAFAKNTTSEVARLGAKVAIGTQTLLEGAEAFLNPQTSLSPRSQHQEWDGDDPSSDTEEPRAVSHYANQPIGVRAGLRSAAHHLERDLLTARDAVIAIPAEVMEEGSGAGMARVLARHAPTVILRPALGATKALSNALLGVGNALDETSRRKIEDVSPPRIVPNENFTNYCATEIQVVLDRQPAEARLSFSVSHMWRGILPHVASKRVFAKCLFSFCGTRA